MSVEDSVASEATDGVQALSEVGRAAGLPLYAQVRDALRQQIDGRSLPPGAPLPTEEALQVRFGVSRSVVRQALGDLADLGLIVRQRGRGSVVAPRPEHRRRADQAGGLRQQVEARGRHLRTEIVALTPDRAPSAAADALGVSKAWRLERIRRVEDEPMVFMRTWLPRELFPHLTAEDLDGGSLHDWMRARGVEPLGGPRQLQAVPADETVAAHLELPVGVPVLLLQGVTRDHYERGLEWFTAWHRPDTVFDVDAQVGARQTRGGGVADVSGAPVSSEVMSNEDLGRARELMQELALLLGTPAPPA
jgi:GntR family transcriptional regulator